MVLHVAHYRSLPALLGLLLLGQSCFAQSLAAPKHETRAVWVATAAGLDWPRTTDREAQQQGLRAIVQGVKQAHLNTIYFQVRARGDAYYRSTIEPWAENLTGTLAKDPGWDPLAFLMSEARSAGLEVHAWFNGFKVRGPNPVPPTTPPHVTRLHPEWVVLDEGEAWLDPGIPAVRRYLLGAALDLIQKYDLDGINFDFLRYPGRNFDDHDSYRRYGGAADRDTWRRSNIDRFVEEFSTRARAVRPWLKIGSSPLGVFETDPISITLGSYHAVYQDAQGWLRRGLHDYLSPQIYWDIGGSKADPDFAALVRRWQESAGARHIYAGIAAYKPEVYKQLARQVDLSRAAGNQGQAFFRYDNIRDTETFGNRYEALSLPAPMPWRDSIPPLSPGSLAVTEVATNVFHLEWTQPPPAADSNRAWWYVVYRNSPSPPQTELASQIVGVVPATRNSYIDTVRVPSGLTYYYAVSALDRANNESEPSLIGTGIVRELIALEGKLSNLTSLAASYGTDSRRPTLLAYKIAERLPVVLELSARGVNGRDSTIAILVRESKNQGTHVIGLADIAFQPGEYTIRLRAGSARLEQPITVRP